MSNIDKRVLREAAEKASADNHTQDEWFHYLRCSTPETVLALLDELEAAERRCAALAAELSSVLTDRAVILEDLDNTCFEIGMQRGEKTEAYPTPVVANHDAFLAEVRAQESKRVYESILDNPAVTDMESLVDWLEQYASDSVAFAAQLRKGGA